MSLLFRRNYGLCGEFSVSISNHLHKLIDVSVTKNSFGNPVLSCHVLTTREIRGYRKMISIMSVYRMQFLTLCSTSVDQIILSISVAQSCVTRVGLVIKGV